MTVEGDETRQKLLEHARQHYLDVGPHQFSLREVARRTGISAAAVYRHFDDKDALLGAICAEGFKTFHGYLMRALKEKTPIERLRAAGRAYRAFGVENNEHYRVIFMSSADVLGKATMQKLAGETATSFQFLVDRVRECQDAKAIRKGDPVEIAATIWSMVHGMVSLHISHHITLDSMTFAAFFAQATDDLLQGLAPAA